MTPKQVKEAIKEYRDFFDRGYFGEIYEKGFDFPHDMLYDYTDYSMAGDNLKHVYGMLDQMEIMVDEGKMEKVFRWLGFVQGVLWTEGAYTLNELKDHNRSREGTNE